MEVGLAFTRGIIQWILKLVRGLKWIRFKVLSTLGFFAFESLVYLEQGQLGLFKRTSHCCQMHELDTVEDGSLWTGS